MVLRQYGLAGSDSEHTRVGHRPLWASLVQGTAQPGSTLLGRKEGGGSGLQPLRTVGLGLVLNLDIIKICPGNLLRNAYVLSHFSHA